MDRRERGGVEGARITLTDEADGGRVLQSWQPEGPDAPRPVVLPARYG
ncbi:hypothetical protein [Streptomyces sp. NBC_01589]